MKIKKYIVNKPKFIKCDLNYLKENINKIKYTRFYVNKGSINEYYFRIGKNYYIVESTDYDSLARELLSEKIKHETKQGKTKVKHSKWPYDYGLTITDLMNLYNHDNNIKVDKWFKTAPESSYGKGTQENFINLVNSVNTIKREMEEQKINIENDKYAVAKFIYDKFKMETSYWNPQSNYGSLEEASVRYQNDPNKVLENGFSYLGLINEKYATCKGMAEGLVQIFRYFGISAEISENRIHSVCRVNLTEGKHTYIDLSKEVTKYFHDNKYTYMNGVAYPLRVNNHIATKDNYNYFLKKEAGAGMPDNNENAVDFQRVKVVNKNIRNESKRVSSLEINNIPQEHSNLNRNKNKNKKIVILNKNIPEKSKGKKK